MDGFRLDVFNEYFKDAEFRDNPPSIGVRRFDRQKHIYDVSQPEMIPLLNEIRGILDKHKNTYVVGETFLASPEQAADYCRGDDKLHAAFNFDFANCRWHPKRFMAAVRKWYASLGEDTWPNNFLSNHDQKRAATRYCLGENDHRAKVAAVMLLTIKGTPYIYYGEEIALRDIPIRRKEDVLDPIGKTFWPFHKGRDGCRAPMQWNSKINAGFSQTKPWLPVNDDYPERNVAHQESDPDSTLNFFKKIIAIRKSEPALQHGDFKALEPKESYIMAYERRLDEDRLVVVLNFSSRDLNFDLPEGNWTPLVTEGQPLSGSIALSPYQVAILKQNK